MSSNYGPNCGKRVIGHLGKPDERELTDIQVFLCIIFALSEEMT
jgi:hypothetical protein